jgi:hypothetical protein
MASWLVIGPPAMQRSREASYAGANVAFAWGGVLLHSVPRRLTAPDPSWLLA